MITIDGAISRTPSTKREKPSIDASVDDTKHSRSDTSMDKDSRLDSRHDSRHDSRDNSTRLDSRTNLTSTDADSKNGTPLLSKKGLSTDGDITPTNSRRMTSTDARSVSGISDLQDIGDSVSQRGSRRGKSIDDTMSHDSSTLHAPASITSGNMSQQVSSHMRSESEDHTTNSLHSMRTPKIEKSTAHDATSITASTTDGSINQSQSIKAEDAVSVSAASATGSTATAGTTRTKHSELNSQMSKTTSANLSSAQATADTASSHGLVPPSSDTTSISNQQLLNSQSIGADATSMTRSDQTPTNQRNSQYLTHSEGGDGKRGLNSADTMSLTTLSRHPSMMSVTSSGQMSSVSQQNRNRSSQQPKKGQNMFQFSGSETASVSSKQAPKMSRVTNIYASVHQGISDYISIFTAELNVLQTQLHMEDTPMQVKIDLEKQLNSTERILTKLQYQQNQATEIYEQYKIQEKYISKQKQLKSELQSTPVSMNNSVLNRLVDNRFVKFFGGDRMSVISENEVNKILAPVTLKRQNSLRRSVMQKSANLVRSGSVRIKNPSLHRSIVETKQTEKKSQEVRRCIYCLGMQKCLNSSIQNNSLFHRKSSQVHHFHQRSLRFLTCLCNAILSFSGNAKTRTRPRILPGPIPRKNEGSPWFCSTKSR